MLFNRSVMYGLPTIQALAQSGCQSRVEGIRCLLANRHEMNQIHSGESESARPKAGPLISSSFLDYKPPFDPTPIAQRMVDSVPEKSEERKSKVLSILKTWQNSTDGRIEK